MNEQPLLTRRTLETDQLARFRTMVEPILQRNRFYGEKLSSSGIRNPEDIQRWEGYRRIPFTSKVELSENQAAHPPYGSNLTADLDQFVRLHQTSGTTGRPLRWLDTPESWAWWGRCWAAVYGAAGVTAKDRIFLAFSFGPFIGFWSAHEGAREIRALVVPGGGMSTDQRLQAILDTESTVLVCTPTYALYLAEVAEKTGIDIAGSGVRATLHAGEPGASLPATKARIERAWGAKAYDHPGATEVGAWGFECQAQDGVHVNESEFIFEVTDPQTGEPADEGELVVTNLGRVGMPVIRYRTGDRVRWAEEACACGRIYRKLSGGVIGRLDDILIVRGVNVYPSAIENAVRQFSAVVEFGVDVHREGALDEMCIRLEVDAPDRNAVADGVSREIRHNLGIRARVEVVPRNTLPRFELKARRFLDHRS